MSYEIENRDGSISAYGFACGYKEACEYGHRFVEIYAEGGVYHVRWWLGDSPIEGRIGKQTMGAGNSSSDYVTHAKCLTR